MGPCPPWSERDYELPLGKHYWGHALNSLELLQSALDDEQTTALEADVSWNSLLGIPVMKHAASSTDPTDLPVSTWLHHACGSASITIIKLDFKAIDAVAPTVQLLKERFQVNAAASSTSANGAQIWLNADVLKGPGTHLAPVPVDRFLDACDQLPHATLSLGWTTGWSPFAKVVYDDAHVNEMVTLLEARREIQGFKRHVTFPVRASLVNSSWNALARLLRTVPDSSLTLWTADEGVPWHDLKIMEWSHPDFVDRLHFDIDKGPKHVRCRFRNRRVAC